jgi:SNF2 family DNA or RNA helicase
MNLYPHQKEALDLVKDKNRCAIYYDMGLGKTFIGSEKMKQLGCKLNLVICQKSKIDDWIEHFEKYYPRYHIINYTVEKEVKRFYGLYANGSPIIIVINYDLVWRRPELLKLSDFTLMLDESSLITNRTAKRSAFILELNPSNVILLSGTPTAGKYEKLWSQLKLLGWNIDEETFFKSYVDYEWVETDGYFEKKIKGYKNVDHLKRRLAKFGAIFKKTNEVIELPEQINQIINIPISKNYKLYEKNHYLEINDRELMGDTVLTRILHERQLCGQYSEDKLEAFKDLIESTEDRIIVFYNFNDELDALKHISDLLGRDSSIVNGKIKDLYAYEHLNDSVTYVQYQAGAYGLNLQKACRIIYYSLPLGIGSCDLWEQSKKRIHRIGQDKTCFYYYLLVDNSIETWNLELLKTGKELTDDLFEKATR